VETTPANRPRHPALWVPSLYFAEGVPYVIVMTMSVVMYTDLGVSKTDIGLCTSWLYLPWVLKPLWSPLVDMKGAKRGWIVAMEFAVSAALALAALSVRGPRFFILSLLVFLLMAFASATHDIAADGFYMLGLSAHGQSWWSGMRSAFYRVAMIAGSGWLVMLAGALEKKDGAARAWFVVLLTAAAGFLLLGAWHCVMLPFPASDGPAPAGRSPAAGFLAAFQSFFQKPGVGMALAFMLTYRFDEAQLSKVLQPFLLDNRPAGGLGLETGRVGLAYGTFGILALTCGGLLGGFAAAKYGLKKVLPFMVCFMYLPKLVFVFLSWLQPSDFRVICGAVAVEQLGYGAGFVAFMLYLLYFSDGPHRTAHYALCTGFMALGMMIPGMWSGWLADYLGYRWFFIWVICSAVPGFIIALRLKVDPQFGRKSGPKQEPLA
jgi:PAT family beta-lactamase induction signal transducer AmpG